MKTIYSVLVIFSLLVCSAKSLPLNPFPGTQAHIDRANNIFIMKCLSVPVPDETGWHYESAYPMEAEVLHILKGPMEKGKIRLALSIADGPMIPGRQYLVFSSQGHALDADLVYGELSTVLMPWLYSFKASYGGKPLDEQVRAIFRDRLHGIEREMQILTKEKGLLEKALKE